MDSLELNRKLEAVESRHDLADFIRDLCRDYIENPEEWENRNLSDFLEAMEAWIRDMDGFYDNQGLPFSEAPSWKLLGTILLASKTYE